jgi:hypothetical protein
MSVSCECCVLSGRGLCDGPITRPEESYRLWSIIVRDLEATRMRWTWPALDCCARETSCGDSGEVWNVGLPSLVWHLTQLGQQSCELYAPAASPPPPPPPHRNFCTFMLNTEWTPGLLNADRWMGALENVKGFYRESNPGPPVLWRSASITFGAEYKSGGFSLRGFHRLSVTSAPLTRMLYQTSSLSSSVIL